MRCSTAAGAQWVVADAGVERGCLPYWLVGLAAAARSSYSPLGPLGGIQDAAGLGPGQI